MFLAKLLFTGEGHDVWTNSQNGLVKSCVCEKIKYKCEWECWKKKWVWKKSILSWCYSCKFYVEKLFKLRKKRMRSECSRERHKSAMLLVTTNECFAHELGYQLKVWFWIQCLEQSINPAVNEYNNYAYALLLIASEGIIVFGLAIFLLSELQPLYSGPSYFYWGK